MTGEGEVKDRPRQGQGQELVERWGLVSEMATGCCSWSPETHLIAVPVIDRTSAQFSGPGLQAEAKMQETVASCPSPRAWFVVTTRRESSSRRALAWLEGRSLPLRGLLTLVSDLTLLSPLTPASLFLAPRGRHPFKLSYYSSIGFLPQVE